MLQDIETFDLEDFKYNSVNMTAFRLVDVENPKVAELLTQMERFQPVGPAILNRSGIIQVITFLDYLVYFEVGSRRYLVMLREKRSNLEK